MEGAQRCAWVGRSGVWGLGRGKAGQAPPSLPQPRGSFSGDGWRGSGKALKQPCAACPPFHNENTALGRWTECSEGWWEKKNHLQDLEIPRGSAFTLTSGLFPVEEVTAHRKRSTLRDYCVTREAELGCPPTPRPCRTTVVRACPFPPGAAGMGLAGSGPGAVLG